MTRFADRILLLERIAENGGVWRDGAPWWAMSSSSTVKILRAVPWAVAETPVYSTDKAQRFGWGEFKLTDLGRDYVERLAPKRPA